VDGQSEEEDEDLCDQEGEELRNSLEECVIREARANINAYENLTRRISTSEWARAEAHHGLGYNGGSKRSKRRARKKVADGKKAQTGHVVMLCSLVSCLLYCRKTSLAFKAYFVPKKVGSDGNNSETDSATPLDPATPSEFLGYRSDLSSSESEDKDDGVEEEDYQTSFPPWKRTRTPLAIPARVTHKAARELRFQKLQEGLVAIEKEVRSRKMKWKGRDGKEGLQAYCARAIQSHLQMVVRSGWKAIKASEIAAEAQGFSQKWGGRLVRKWVRKWVSARELPESLSGRHVKAFTLLDDPEICAELCVYVRSNKWSMNPEKLAQYSQDKMVTTEAAKYIQHVVHHEMLRGLRKYLEVDLFPRIQLKAGKGISISTARRWLQREGFQYMEHKKSLYYDGHDRPDVLAYRQNEFLPRMREL
jgi:hypothetical protein